MLRLIKSFTKSVKPNSSLILMSGANQRLSLMANTFRKFSSSTDNSSTLTQVVEPKQAEVLHRKQFTGRTFILNRPKALNALNVNMVRNMLPQLQAWDQSDLCKVIILKSNHPKAFCAGGDVKAIVELAKKKDTSCNEFFREEYVLNHLIATMKTPLVSFMDGITMGGGVGLSVHAPFRIATEKTLFAMPETSIGLFPDVGGSFFLPRLDGQLGTFLGLTGHRLNGRDVFMSGVATHYVPSNRLQNLEDRLNELDSDDLDVINSAIEDFVAEPEMDYHFELDLYRDIIDRCFKHNSVKDIILSLQSEPEHKEWCLKIIDTLNSMSPTSLIVTREQLRQGLELNITEAFNLEAHLGKKFLEGHDFIEGVTSKLINKPPTSPKWSPLTLDEADEQSILTQHFTNVELNSLPVIHQNANFINYPNSKYTLPTELEVKQYIEEASISTRPTVDDLANHFLLIRDNKVGTKQKLLSILQRICTIDPQSNEIELKSL